MRSISISALRELRRVSGEHILLAFVTVEHVNLATPLRFVNDVADYILGGNTYTGVLFGFNLLPDGDESPTTEIVIPNVDRKIGVALRPMSGRAKVSLTIYLSSDFNLSVEPRTEIGTASIIYSFTQFDLVSVEGNAIQITGTLILRDTSQEQWPGISATKTRCPALWR